MKRRWTCYIGIEQLEEKRGKSMTRRVSMTPDKHQILPDSSRIKLLNDFVKSKGIEASISFIS